MQSPPKPNNNHLFSFLMKREQGYRAQERESNIIPKMDKRAIISKREFDSAIKKAKKSNEVGNARLNFPMRDLREITFPPAVTEANETNETNETNTTYIRSCFIGATFKDKANLPDLNFQKANFSHAKLREANLTGADLSGADLSGADLTGANLKRANLDGANLNGANLSGVDLEITTFNGADLRGADLRGADVGLSEFIRADLSGANLSGLDISGNNFTGANLIGADLQFSFLDEADLSYAKLNDADLRCVKLIGANLNGANLSGVNLSGLNLEAAKFSNANLSNSNLTNAKIRGDFSGADLSGADFSGTLKASITGSYYSDISAENVSKILDKLDDAQIKKMLGIDDKVTVKQYLENLLTTPEVKNDKSTHKESQIDNINKVIAVIISFEEKIKSTTPSPNTQPSVGGKRKREESLGDGGSARKPEGR